MSRICPVLRRPFVPVIAWKTPESSLLVSLWRPSPDLLMALISFAGGDLEKRRTGRRMVRDPGSRFRAFWSRISRLAGGLTPDESMI